MRYLILTVLVLVGCSTSPTPEITLRPTTENVSEGTQQVIDTPTEPTVESPTEPPPTPTDIAPAMAEAAPNGQNLLVALTTSSAPGQIALMDRAGAVLPLMDIPAGAARVVPCGNEATSPDGRFFAFYMGNNTAGNLYLMAGANTPTQIDDAEYLVCLGNGTFRFSPDSSRFGFIDFLPGVTREEYPDGVLKLFDSASAGEIVRFDNVTAFDMTNDSAAFVSFFTNNRNEANEAAITLWDGTTAREITTLLPTAERCWFTSAALAFAPNGNLMLVLGHRCATGNTGTQWQLYTIDPSSSSATFVSSDFQPGAFVPFARNNHVFFSPDGAFGYFTVPDGVTAYTVAIAAVDLNDMAISVPVGRQAVFPNFTGTTNATPRFSPDRRWLAMVVTSPNNDNQIMALDLASPSTPPISISAGSRGSLIPGFAITRDGEQVVYVAGGTEGADNSLLALNLAAGSERRVVRGHFVGEVVVAPDGNMAALRDWQRVETPREPMYTNLLLVNLADSAVTTLFTGADVVDGRVVNPRTAVPLAWR